jgi:D-amino-acid oxidase
MTPTAVDCAEPAVVVGAGVMGLSVALKLAQNGWRVRVLARELPADTTSAVAAAIWYPYRIQPFARVLDWAERSLVEFHRLADDPLSGVVLREGAEFLRSREPDPWWRPLVPGMRRLDAVPFGYVDGWAFSTPVIEMPRYLSWLESQLKALGVRVEQVELNALSDAPVVVNCTGLGACDLVGDASMMPVRGQVVVVSQVGVERWTLDGSGLTYVVPRSRDIVVGGTDVEGEWDVRPDPDVAAAILSRATSLVPELATAEVLGHRVGLRPARPEVRLELERSASGGRVVHCYGHGGAGVTVSWGCAEEVLALLSG